VLGDVGALAGYLADKGAEPSIQRHIRNMLNLLHLLLLVLGDVGSLAGHLADERIRPINETNRLTSI
jgi:hypothetical protein